MAGSKKAGTLVDPAKSKAKAKKAKSEGPKRAASAYILFCKEKREELGRSNPELKGKDVVVELAKMWKDTTEDEKLPYQKMHSEEVARSQQELEAMKGKDAEEDEVEEKPKRKTTKSPKRSSAAKSKSPKRSRSKSPPKQKADAGRKGPKAVAADAEAADDEKKMKKGRMKGKCGGGNGW